ncbi:MAG TPA: helix-turn-helix domain-containing protein [Acidimicrobiales bacterium]
MGTEPAAAASSLADEQRDLARRRIVRAARRVLAERGLAATVEDVADAAGVSRRTVFRHFATRENLFAVAIRDGLRTYGEHIPPGPGDDLATWLLDVLQAAHRLNAGNGRIYWELAVLEPDLSGELAAAAAERRQARTRFAEGTTRLMWRARGGTGQPPRWLTDAVAVHLSGFTTQSLAGDFGRSPDDVARVSARVLGAALDAALAERAPHTAR